MISRWFGLFHSRVKRHLRRVDHAITKIGGFPPRQARLIHRIADDLHFPRPENQFRLRLPFGILLRRQIVRRLRIRGIPGINVQPTYNSASRIPTEAIREAAFKGDVGLGSSSGAGSVRAIP